MKKTDRIITILADIDHFQSDFTKLSGSSVPEEKDIARYHAISMVLFTLLNLCFELGEEVISLIHGKIPYTYRDIFTVLHENGIIDETLMNTMSDLVYYRNRLAHQYSGFNRNDLEAIIEKMEAVKDYVGIVKQITTDIIDN